MINSGLLPCHGDRISLRRLSPEDLTPFQAYRCDPKVGEFQGWSPMPDSEAITFLETMSRTTLLQPGEWCQIGIAERDTDTLIGDIGICVGPKQKEAEIGFTLRAESQGFGLGSEAVKETVNLLFENTPVDRVICVTDARNLPAIRLLQRIGMQQIEKRNAIFRGETCVEYRFTLSRIEHSELQGQRRIIDDP